MAARREAQPRPDADPRAIHARILFLAWRDRLPEAELEDIRAAIEEEN